MIEGRFMRNLRTLLVLVIFLGTAQYLVGSFVLQPARERVGDTSIRNVEKHQYILPALKKVMREISIGGTGEKSSDTASLIEEMVGASASRNFSFERGRQFTQMTQNEKEKTNTTTFCPAKPPGLGPFHVNLSAIALRDVEEKYPEVQKGGYYRPPNCTAIHKVAIIVPYRDRIDQLGIFLNNIHPFLMRQQIEYRIFVVEQRDSGPFNRGKLFNVGFVESQKLGYHCFVVHDVDMIPLDTRNVYSCPRHPRHMVRTNDSYHEFKPVEDEAGDEEDLDIGVEDLRRNIRKMQKAMAMGWPMRVIRNTRRMPRFEPAIPTTNLFEFVGVVTAMTEEQFRKVNGFSNKYKNWGGEDEDMSIRLKVKKLQVARYDPSISRYVMLNHTIFFPDPRRNSVLLTADRGFWTDGLNTLQYEILSTNENHLYTHWMADLDKQGKTPSSLQLLMGFISGS